MPEIKNRLDVRKQILNDKLKNKRTKEGPNNQFRLEGFPTVKIEHKDVFSWEDFYLLLHEWFIDEEYTSGDSDFPESFFSQKESPFGKELWIRWRFNKKVDNFKWMTYFMDVDIHVLGLKEVEIIVDGKKKKADKGEVSIEIRPQFALDFSEWQKNSILSLFKEYITSWFYREKVNYYKKELFMELLDVQNAIKAYFKLVDASTEQQFKPVKS